MKRHRLKFLSILLVGLISCLVWLTQATLASANRLPQIPTGSIPTVTGTPIGALAVVLDNEQGFVNVRAGPGTVNYDIVGVLVVGQQVPALGRTKGGDWVQVAYPGVSGGVAWVYSDLVEIKGSLSVVEPPPTSTPQVTATIDPTLAAQFLVEAPPTRLPTFTEPAPVSMPTYALNAPITTPSRIPMGLVVIGLAVVGLFGLLISFLGGR